MKPMATNGMAPSFFPANFILQMQQPLPHHHHHHPQQEHPHHEHEQHLLAPPPPSLSPFLHDFGGAMAPPMLAGGIGNKPPMYPPDAMGDDLHAEPQQQDGAASDDEEGSAAAAGGGERKRRLSVEQVRTLERSFEVANKLEPERKAQLARALGLQPRQVAIWFQNRRARWKTKQLEKDYDVLRRQLDAAHAENDALLAQNKKLHAEIMALKGGVGGAGGGGRQEAASELINLNVKETEASCSNRSENSSEINLDISRPASAAAADEGPMNNNHRAAALPFYASAVRCRPGGGGSLDIDQLLQHSHTSAPKIELAHGDAATAGAVTFGSLLCSGAVVDEQPPFWPWATDGHHNFQ